MSRCYYNTWKRTEKRFRQNWKTVLHISLTLSASMLWILALTAGHGRRSGRSVAPPGCAARVSRSRIPCITGSWGGRLSGAPTPIDRIWARADPIMEASGVAIIAGSKNTLDGRPLLPVSIFFGLNRGPFYFSTYSIIEEPSLNKGVCNHWGSIQVFRNIYKTAFVGHIIWKRRLHQTVHSWFFVRIVQNLATCNADLFSVWKFWHLQLKVEAPGHRACSGCLLT